MVETFEDGEALLRAAERRRHRVTPPYRSGESRDWVKMKETWRETNQGAVAVVRKAVA
jgi:hypothetical protein